MTVATPANGPVVAIIPARGGSKRIPRKNIKPFLGVPLISRTIATLHESDLFDRIVVSTDDDDIAAVATDSGAEVPFRRPDDLADDHTGTRPVIMHAIAVLEDQEGRQLGPVCSVYPAAVFVRPEDLRAGLGLLVRASVDFVVSAAAFPSPIQRALRQRSDGMAEMFWPEHRETRSQDLEEAFHDAGQFYWGQRSAWLCGTSSLSGNSRLYVLPRWQVHDIDTPEDWELAELMWETLERRG